MLKENSSVKMLLVLVNYFNDEEIIHFVCHELKVQDGEGVQIVVVNNGSKNEPLLIDRLRNEGVEVLLPNKNCGYLHGFNFAVHDFLQKNKSLPRLLVLCNSDMHFMAKDILSSVISKYSTTKYACIGPSIISTRTHTDQNPFMKERISLRKLKFLEMIQGNYVLYYLYQVLALIKGKVKQVSNDFGSEKHSSEVYSIHGSFMVFNGNFISTAWDDFNKAPFLFGEEVCIAELARKYGYKLIYDPAYVIQHNEHATTRTFKSRKTLKWMHDSTKQIIADFFNY